MLKKMPAIYLLTNEETDVTLLVAQQIFLWKLRKMYVVYLALTDIIVQT